MIRKVGRQSKPRVPLGQEMELSGRWNADFIWRQVGSHRKALNRRAMLSDLGSTRIPLAPIGGWPTGWENRVRETAGYCTRPGRRQ